ncbi:MAG: hypothetical protein J1F20_04975 [Muribaculaceae bacterium]|nr:hypothetical protein [Muribaculaceae bacterium]
MKIKTSHIGILLVGSVFFTYPMLFSQGRNLIIPSNIDSIYNARICFNYPIEYDANPIIIADKPWEFNANGDPYAAPFSGGVWYDEEVSLFKMWYSAGGHKKHGLITCYAESKDGIDWHKPSLDVIEGTNIVDTLEHDCVTVLLDKYECDRSKRYKMFCVQFDTPSAVSMVLKYSKDGIHWGDHVALSGDLYDRCSAYYDPFRDTYVLSLKTKDADNRRARNYLANKDPELAVSLAHRVYGNNHDKFIKFWFSAQDDDPRHPDFPEIAPAIYNHDAIAYENILLGQFVVWQGPENKDCVKLNVQKRNEILIGFSKDGFHWERPDKTPFIGVSSDSLAWNAGNIQSSMGSPLIVGDSLYFYYSGRYNSRPVHPSNFATGLAKMRRDGFSRAQTKGKGFIITKPTTICGDILFINADVSNPDACIEIEILNDNYEKIGSFQTVSDINSTKYMCVPESQEMLNKIKGKQVCLKFNMTDAALYSYWFSNSPNGESGGYTAGGGPGLSSSGKDIAMP